MPSLFKTTVIAAGTGMTPRSAQEAARSPAIEDRREDRKDGYDVRRTRNDGVDARLAPEGISQTQVTVDRVDARVEVRRLEADNVSRTDFKPEVARFQDSTETGRIAQRVIEQQVVEVEAEEAEAEAAEESTRVESTRETAEPVAAEQRSVQEDRQERDARNDEEVNRALAQESDQEVDFSAAREAAEAYRDANESTGGAEPARELMVA